MRNGFVMLLFCCCWCWLAGAQASYGGPSQHRKSSADQLQTRPPEPILNVLPAGLSARISQWEVIGRKDRQVKGWYANGQLAVTFAHKSGHLNGRWQTWYENGRTKEDGHFKNGYPDGNWKFWYESGVVRSERNFSASKMQSMNIASRQRNPKLQFVPSTGTEPSSKEATSFNPIIYEATHGGFHFEMPFRKAVHEGDFVLYAEDGRVVERGKFSNGLRDGQWLYHNRHDNTTISGYYSNGIKHGPWKAMLGDNMLRLEEYREGVLLHRKQYSH